MRRREAILRGFGLALKLGGIEVAMARIVDDSVLEPVLGIALRNRGGSQLSRQLVREAALRVLEIHLRDENPTRLHLHEIDRRGADNDAVIIVWIAFRLAQPFPTPRRATAVISTLRGLLVVSGDDLFTRLREQVVRAVREVDEALRVTFEPLILEEALLRAMTRVGGSCRIALAESRPHGGIVDGTGQPAVAHSLELPIPVPRQPDFEVDFLLDDADHATERLLYAHRTLGEPFRHSGKQRRRIDPDGVGIDLLHYRDPGVGKLRGFQCTAITGSGATQLRAGGPSYRQVSEETHEA